jgi:HSP20 family protein
MLAKNNNAVPEITQKGDYSTNFESMLRRFFDMAGFKGDFDFGTSKLEVKINDKDVCVKLPAPGRKEDDFEVETVGDFISVRVKHSSECICRDKEKNHFIIRERECGEFEESVKLPVKVIASQAKAAYADGVLTISIPREEIKTPESHIVKVN